MQIIPSCCTGWIIPQYLVRWCIGSQSEALWLDRQTRLFFLYSMGLCAALLYPPSQLLPLLPSLPLLPLLPCASAARSPATTACRRLCLLPAAADVTVGSTSSRADPSDAYLQRQGHHAIALAVCNAVMVARKETAADWLPAAIASLCAGLPA